MANYSKFSIYDLELASICHNSELRRLLVSTSNRSILVIEILIVALSCRTDNLVDMCSMRVACTNHKERLDSALLRPGRRMDMHIHMSYCTPSAFRNLVSNYLGMNINDDHNLFLEIDELMTEVQVTPAEIAEELMRNEDADISLDGLIKFLQRKKIEVVEDEARVGDTKRKTMTETETEDEDDQHNFINNCKTKKMTSIEVK
ncbi:hypothetical protein Ddye_031531 [Dipteronia dyeriana]|uniref:AAA+ ATPase At3g28540-like C-terminal domain-containing protein n=1 Tax=Dipteronia dyeriana TaxID=168575 RepID=A0AAD9TJH4_9ROSI|nr:hypothetical protein Ddye_031531 [Dipteronia dyeriana]